MHRWFKGHFCFYDVLQVLLVLRGQHLVRNGLDDAKVEHWATLLILQHLRHVHVDAVLSILYALRIGLIAWVVEHIQHFLVVDENQIPQKHPVCISLKLVKRDLVHSPVHDGVSLLCSQPSLLDRNLIRHIVDVEVEDVEHG